MNRFRMFIAVLAVLLAQPVLSDELRPGYLEMRQTGPGTYNLLFKIPARGEDSRLAIYVSLPEGTQDVTPPRASFSDGAYVERRTIRRDGGLIGQPVAIEGLSLDELLSRLMRDVATRADDDTAIVGVRWQG